jgi:hypothetical protein
MTNSSRLRATRLSVADTLADIITAQ